MIVVNPRRSHTSHPENMVSVKRARRPRPLAFIGVEEQEQNDEYRARYAPEQEGLTAAIAHRHRGVDC